MHQMLTVEENSGHAHHSPPPTGMIWTCIMKMTAAFS